MVFFKKIRNYPKWIGFSEDWFFKSFKFVMGPLEIYNFEKFPQINPFRTFHNRVPIIILVLYARKF